MEQVKLNRIEIKNINDKWLLNGRTYAQASKPEKEFLNKIFRDFKNNIQIDSVKYTKS
jgi:hypothetical protein